MKSIVLVFTLIFCSISFAGPGHGHSHGTPEISQLKAEEVGQHHLKRLVEAKKIDATWLSGVFEKAEKKSFGNKKEWTVTFLNEKGTKGKRLFIFLQTSGDFVAANFTGK